MTITKPRVCAPHAEHVAQQKPYQRSKIVMLCADLACVSWGKEGNCDLVHVPYYSALLTPTTRGCQRAFIKLNLHGRLVVQEEQHRTTVLQRVTTPCNGRIVAHEVAHTTIPLLRHIVIGAVHHHTTG